MRSSLSQSILNPNCTLATNAIKKKKFNVRNIKIKNEVFTNIKTLPQIAETRGPGNVEESLHMSANLSVANQSKQFSEDFC